jgi:hypothetical protein
MYDGVGCGGKGDSKGTLVEMRKTIQNDLVPSQTTAFLLRRRELFFSLHEI